MTEIRADLIKELRALTGVGMTKCKEALQAASGNLQEAIDYLRKKGMSSGAKKEGRETKEGMIVAAQSTTHLVLVELNVETDFVVQSEAFRAFAADIAEQALQEEITSLEAFLQKDYAKDPTLSLEQHRNVTIQSLGENLQIRRIERIQKESGSSYGIYSHMGGKLVSVVQIAGSETAAKLGQEIAMHVVACHPEFLCKEEVSQNILAREKEIVCSQMQGKPASVIDKIVAGKRESYFKENCLREQPFVKDASFTVEKFVENQGKEDGKTLTLARFWRWKVGQEL
ncbi:MAG: translation elongation factor Ts [Chlamydiota bacterium]